MTKPFTRILAINPGTRYIGIAAFEDHELQDWQTVVIRSRCFEDALHQIELMTEWLIERHEADILAIKRIHPARSSDRLNQVVTEIKNISQDMGLRTFQYPIGEFKKCFSVDGKMNKAMLAEAVVARYPNQLQHSQTQHTNNDPYHFRMYEAIALGLYCFQQLNNH